MGRKKHTQDTGLQVEWDASAQRLHMRGALDLAHLTQAENALARTDRNAGSTLDLSGLTKLDTAGALLIHEAQAHGLELGSIRPEHAALLELVERAKIGEPPPRRARSSFRALIIKLGRATIYALRSLHGLIDFLGQACVALARVIRHPSRLRVTSISYQIQAIGIEALPIIAVVAFVISIVLAYQGQAQLRPLGAQQFTVNLIAISVLREMGVLLTAIMLAGRSGSAFAAQIGVMNLREETDALRVIGMDPFELLVLPRMLALLLALPLLTFFADMMGLLGGALVSWALMDMSTAEYAERVRQTVSWEDFMVGMIKAPVFAIIISLVGCMHGLRVTGSAESVGRETTLAVVQSIFLVLLVDGLFSIYFGKVGL